jgi:hypothetical protein
MLTFRSILSSAVVSLLWLTVGVVPAEAQAPRFPFHYAAKIVCGAPQEVRSGALVPQAYATTINIHNPGDSEAIFLKSLVVTIPPGQQRPAKPRTVAEDRLPPDGALATDCTDIRKRVPNLPAFFEGFVLLDSRSSLDVVAVYSVPGGIDVVNVPERRRAQ